MDSRKFQFVLIALSFSLSGCPAPEEELPVGPCNNDGETGTDPRAPLAKEPSDDPSESNEVSDAHSPILRSYPGWTFDDHIGGFHRLATAEERALHAWATSTRLVAWPISPIARADAGVVSVTLPVARPLSAEPSLIQTQSCQTVDLVLKKSAIWHSVTSSNIGAPTEPANPYSRISPPLKIWRTHVERC